MFRYYDIMKGREMIDFTRLNEWLERKGTVKKKLDEMTNAELNKTVTQFKKIQASDLAKRA